MVYLVFDRENGKKCLETEPHNPSILLSIPAGIQYNIPRATVNNCIDVIGAPRDCRASASPNRLKSEPKPMHSESRRSHQDRRGIEATAAPRAVPGHPSAWQGGAVFPTHAIMKSARRCSNACAAGHHSSRSIPNSSPAEAGQGFGHRRRGRASEGMSGREPDYELLSMCARNSAIEPNLTVPFGSVASIEPSA